MARTKIAGIGTYLPEKVVTNNDLSRVMDTSDEWIQERTGIVERRYAKKHEESTSTMGAAAARIAMEQAGVTPNDIDFVIFATLSPDYFFPGCGVLLQRQLKLRDIGCLDVRNQCSGFIYGLSVADQFIRSGMSKNILLPQIRTVIYYPLIYIAMVIRQRHWLISILGVTVVYTLAQKDLAILTRNSVGHSSLKR